MPPLLLINPNTARATTAMMVAMARETAGTRMRVRGETATHGPPMITTPEALAAAEAGVIDIALRHADTCAGIVVAAFGDPGVATLKRRLAVPVVGICEAAMVEAAAHDGRFAVATTTKALVARIAESATALGLGHRFAGTWLTGGDPADLVKDPVRLEAALAKAIEAAIRDGGAPAVIIGGGPLSRAAAALSARFDTPIIAPVAAAVRHLLRSASPAG
jgi:Asp/Glu/hydantoin racemase